MILGLNLDSVFESWSSKPAGLQRICMILGLNQDSVFGSWSLKKKGWDKCLQKPRIHDAKLILEILLFGPWSSKLPSFECFCMILELSPDSALLSLSSKLPGLQRICMILGLNPGSVLGSWSFKKKDETNVYKCLQKPLIHDVKLILEILLFGSWPSKLPSFECFLYDFGTKSKFSFGILILQTSPNQLVYSVFAWSWGLNLPRGSRCITYFCLNKNFWFEQKFLFTIKAQKLLVLPCLIHSPLLQWLFQSFSSPAASSLCPWHHDQAQHLFIALGPQWYFLWNINFRQLSIASMATKHQLYMRFES